MALPLLVGTLLIASGSVASAGTKHLTCPAATAVNTASGGSFGAPKFGSAFAGSGYCTYKASTGGKTLTVAYSKLGKQNFAKLAKTEAGKHDHISSVSGVGQSAVHGSGPLDVLFVHQGSSIYEVLDNTKQATVPQLVAVAKLIVPA
ncbi:MAG TPA: hypothetical protein VHV57_17975 [Acidimicrobiales bacterium]|jgi:hypothetical protein|nr:hypothetical protein [Acidimicrobiales bacterium]